MDVTVYFTIIVVSFLASLTVYFQVNIQPYLRMFPLFLLLTLVIEVISQYLISHKRQPTILYSFFTSFEFIFYLYTIREIVHSRRMKKYILISIWFFILALVMNFLFLQQIHSFSSLTYSVGCLLIASGSVYYFYELFQEPHAINLVHQPAFWICSGLLFFYSCTFPIYGVLNLIRNAPDIIKVNIRWIIILLNVFLYSSFTIAFLCRLRTRKSMS